MQIAENSTDLDQKISVLCTLIDLYTKTNQPELARTTVDKMLPLVAPLPSDSRDDHYTRLVLAMLMSNDAELRSHLLSQLSSTDKQIEVLAQIAQQFAAQNNAEQAIAFLDQAINLAQENFSANKFEEVLASLANSYSPFNTGNDYFRPLPERNPAEIALMLRFPAAMSNPLLRANTLMSFAHNLPPTEAQKAYDALPAALAEISDPYARRNLLWEELTEAISYKQLDHATKLAKQLDGEYQVSALALIDPWPR